MNPLHRKVLAAALVVPFVALMGWLLLLTHQRETGAEVIVAVDGYDPRDLLSGHYIQYKIHWGKTNCAQFDDGVCPRDDFCQDNRQRRGERVCRFYVPEKDAGTLDGLLALNDGQASFEVVYSYHPGKKPLAKKLLINSQDWKEYLSQ